MVWEKTFMDLDKKIKQSGKIIKVNSTGSIVKGTEMEIKNTFVAKVPYKEFEIILLHPFVQKSVEKFYLERSKYGWWTFCAKKNKLDKFDKELLLEKPIEIKLEEGIHQQIPSKYGQYREGDHSFCNDNMHEGTSHYYKEEDDKYFFDKKYYYNLHPNDMLKEMKQQIDKFYRDREKLILLKSPNKIKNDK